MNKDGGYNLVKGISYQFDKTILEILKYPFSRVGIEQEFDVKRENYILEVKNYESQKFYPSKLKKVLIQLIHDFQLSKRKYVLYAHFKNEIPRTIKLSAIEINSILKDDSSSLNSVEEFSKNFEIIFSKNYTIQNEETIKRIYQLYVTSGSVNEAKVLYALIKNYLFNVVIECTLNKRFCSKLQLDKLIQDYQCLSYCISYALLNPDKSQSFNQVLNADHKVKVPIKEQELFSSFTCVYGKTGSGKTQAIKVLIDTLLNKNYHGVIVILDPNNEYFINNSLEIFCQDHWINDEFKMIIRDGINHTKNKIVIFKLAFVDIVQLDLYTDFILKVIFQFSQEIFRKGSSPISILTVCEEAHLLTTQGSTSQTITRILKEGRKYGTSLMLSSQQPSLITDLINSQISNFIILNIDETEIDNLKGYSENVKTYSDSLTSLNPGEALIFGSFTYIPTLVKFLSDEY